MPQAAPATPAEVKADAEFQADLRKSFIESLPATLATLRASLQGLTKADNEPVRLKQLFELHRRIRALTGNAGIGHGNFFIEKGVQTPEQILAGIPNGFYVTELMGFGVNIVNGDYSRGAAGMWIRNGELAFAVSEVTIAGHMREMFKQLTPANDLEFRYATNAPTLRIEKMMVAGA